MVHLTIQQLSSHLDGELSEASKALVERHVASCEACASCLAKLAAQEEALVQALTSDPDDEFFDGITHGIEERMSLARRSPVQARPVAPVAASSPPLRESLTRAGDRRANRSSFWPTAVIIVLVVGSAGFTIYGASRVATLFDPLEIGYEMSHAASRKATPPEAVAREADSIAAVPAVPIPDPVRPAPEEAPAPPRVTQAESHRAHEAEHVPRRTEPIRERVEAVAPAREIVPPVPSSPVTEEAAGASGDTAADAQDTAGAEAGNPVQTAQSLSEAAAANPSAEAYDTAAEEWERALPRLQGEPYRDALMRVAEARFRAWGLEPSEERASGVAAAVRTYLVGAPPGPDRERARRWLAQVEQGGSQ